MFVDVSDLCRPVQMRRAAVAKDEQRDGDKAAYEEQPILGYAEPSSQRGRRCVVSRSMPKVNIVTGHGVPPNIGISG